MDYKDSGVDREAAYSFIDQIQVKTKRRFREEVLSDLGDFGAFFQAPKYLKDPIFVATTDGVGTKLLLAEEAGGRAHRAVGQDAVAMCVNDLLACRAEPLVFLDYLATGKLEPTVLSHLLDGIVDACEESGCSLIGGETAQMPGFYPGGRYDVAGFCIGALERTRRFYPENIVAGDVVMGFASAGFHSNGFSLVRKVLDDQKWKLHETFEGQTLGESLLTPTRLYVKPLLKIFRDFEIKGAAHITGGGLVDNLPRAVQESKVQIRINEKAIPTSATMRRFVEAAKLSRDEAFSTWNMGVGFSIFMSRAEADRFLKTASHQSPWPVFEMGVVESRQPDTKRTVMIQ